MALHPEAVQARIAKLREDSGLTQEQAAAKAGVTLRQWQRWEAGQSMPYPRNLSVIAEQFGIDVQEFFTASPNGGKPATVQELSDKVDQLSALVGDLVSLLAPEKVGEAVETAAEETAHTSAEPSCKRAAKAKKRAAS